MGTLGAADLPQRVSADVVAVAGLASVEGDSVSAGCGSDVSRVSGEFVQMRIVSSIYFPIIL